MAATTYNVPCTACIVPFHALQHASPPASKRFTVSLHDSPPWPASKRFIVSLHDSPPWPASKRFTVSLHDSPPWPTSKRFTVSLHDSPPWPGALYAVLCYCYVCYYLVPCTPCCVTVTCVITRHLQSFVIPR